MMTALSRTVAIQQRLVEDELAISRTFLERAAVERARGHVSEAEHADRIARIAWGTAHRYYPLVKENLSRDSKRNIEEEMGQVEPRLRRHMPC